MADAYCGPGARASGRGCTSTPCAPGEGRDVASGACVPPLTLRGLAERQRIPTFPDESLECKGARPPVVDRGGLACVPADALCPRGDRGPSCRPSPACAPGEAPETAERCAPLLTEGTHGAPFTVNVARWARAFLGPDGGEGSPTLCQPLALRPRTFNVDPRATRQVRITLDLRFPNNDISQVYVRTSAQEDGGQEGLSSDATALVEGAVRPLMEALRAMGGEASTAAIRTSAVCKVRGDDAPRSAAPGKR
jgi:hypothetical protein